MPQRRTRPARPLVGLTSSSAAPSAATVEVAAAAQPLTSLWVQSDVEQPLSPATSPRAQASTQRNATGESPATESPAAAAVFAAVVAAAMAIVAALAIAPAASPRAAIDARAAVASLALRWSTPRSGTAATAATVPFRRSPAATAVTATAAATPAAIFAAIADAAERRGV